jgi:hypothetical protein
MGLRLLQANNKFSRLYQASPGRRALKPSVSIWNAIAVSARIFVSLYNDVGCNISTKVINKVYDYISIFSDIGYFFSMEAKIVR